LCDLEQCLHKHVRTELLLLQSDVTATTLSNATVWLIYIHTLLLQHVLLHAATQARMITFQWCKEYLHSNSPYSLIIWHSPVSNT